MNDYCGKYVVTSFEARLQALGGFHSGVFAPMADAKRRRAAIKYARRATGADFG